MDKQEKRQLGFHFPIVDVGYTLVHHYFYGFCDMTCFVVVYSRYNAMYVHLLSCSSPKYMINIHTQNYEFENNVVHSSSTYT